MSGDNANYGLATALFDDGVYGFTTPNGHLVLAKFLESIEASWDDGVQHCGALKELAVVRIERAAELVEEERLAAPWDSIESNYEGFRTQKASSQVLERHDEVARVGL
jgi:hypothetical protein